MMEHEKLYKIDTTGRVRIWWIESSDTTYRTHSGLIDGKIVVSGWQYPEEKNVGRSNATTISEQVLSEVKSKYEYQQYQGKYAQSADKAQQGAKFVECMLASKFDVKKHTKFPYWSQPKLDGIRCLVGEDGMQSRNGKPLLSAPHIRDALDDFFAKHPDVVLDGELYNHNLKDDFEKIISLARKSKPDQEDLEESSKMVEYHIYDVITPEPMTYTQRQDFLIENFTLRQNMIEIVPCYNVNSLEEIEEKLGEYLEDGYEGQMIRVDNAPYEPKRSANLIKHKTFEDGEYEIVDILEGKGNWRSCAKRVEIKLPDGSTQYAGMRGNLKFAKDLLKNKNEYIGGNSQVTVRYQNKTSDDKLRFPIAVAFWKGGRNL
jgi:DNA ligase-1